MNYENISAAVGENVQGTAEFFYICPVADIEVFAELPAAPTNLAESVTLTGSHTMVTSKIFYKVPVVALDKNNAASEAPSSVLGSSPKQVFNAFIAGLTPQIQGFLKKANGEKHIVLIPLPDGQYLQMGTSLRGAQVISNFDTTAAGGDGRGNTIVISSDHTEQFYTGTITLS